MSVEFDADNLPPEKYKSNAVSGQLERLSSSNFFIKMGLANNSRQAYILSIFLIIVFIIAAIVVYYVFVVNSAHPLISTDAIYNSY